MSQKAARSAIAWARKREGLRRLDQPHDPRECRPLSRAGHRNAQRIDQENPKDQCKQQDRELVSTGKHQPENQNAQP